MRGGSHKKKPREAASPKAERRLASGKIRRLPPTLRDGTCRGCGRKVDPVTGDCGCTS